MDKVVITTFSGQPMVGDTINTNENTSPQCREAEATKPNDNASEMPFLTGSHLDPEKVRELQNIASSKGKPKSSNFTGSVLFLTPANTVHNSATSPPPSENHQFYSKMVLN